MGYCLKEDRSDSQLQSKSDPEVAPIARLQRDRLSESAPSCRCSVACARRFRQTCRRVIEPSDDKRHLPECQNETSTRRPRANWLASHSDATTTRALFHQSCHRFLAPQDLVLCLVWVDDKTPKNHACRLSGRMPTALRADLEAQLHATTRQL